VSASNEIQNQVEVEPTMEISTFAELARDAGRVTMLIWKFPFARRADDDWSMSCPKP
jgi:hypothetical protein